MAEVEEQRALSNGSPTIQELLLQKIERILESENIILLVVTHWLQSLDNSSTDLFQGHGIIKWIYYACQVLHTAAHVINAMELSSRRLIFQLVKIVFGFLGVELFLWTRTSRIWWTLLSLCVLVLALASTEFINLLRKLSQPLDDDPFSEVDLDTL